MFVLRIWIWSETNIIAYIDRPDLIVILYCYHRMNLFNLYVGKLTVTKRLSAVNLTHEPNSGSL